MTQNFAHTAVTRSKRQHLLADKAKGKASEKRNRLSTYGKITTIAIIAFALLAHSGILVWKDSRRCYFNFANCFGCGCGAYEEAGYQGASRAGFISLRLSLL